MCASRHNTSEVRPGDGDGLPDNGAEPQVRFQGALADLAKAIAARQADPICAAYLVLRAAGRGMPPEEVLDRAGSINGHTARDMIVSAFSHRRCFMCDDGTTACQTCDGTGTLDGLPCPNCDGLGAEVCPFCMGAAWSDEEQAPAEIRRQVRRRRLARVNKDIARLAKLPFVKAPASARRVPPDQRRELAAWLFRLRGRLNRLAGSDKANGDPFATRCHQISRRIERVVDALRTEQPPPAADKSDEPT